MARTASASASVARRIVTLIARILRASVNENEAPLEARDVRGPLRLDVETVALRLDHGGLDLLGRRVRSLHEEDAAAARDERRALADDRRRGADGASDAEVEGTARLAPQRGELFAARLVRLGVLDARRDETLRDRADL